MSRAVLASIIVLTAVLGACSSEEDRPTVDTWQPRWEQTRDLVPDAATIRDDGADACGTFLGEIRERREELTPAPTETAENAFTAWVEEAEALGLDCDNGAKDVEERLDDLHELARRVDATLGSR